jgi:hypothetical protein
MNDNTQINHPAFKMCSVIFVWMCGMTWGDIASMLAAIYTMCLIVEWLWKKVAKPIAIHNRWIHSTHGRDHEVH